MRVIPAEKRLLAKLDRNGGPDACWPFRAARKELRAEIMAEVHAAIWQAIGIHVNGPSPGVAAPIGAAPYSSTHAQPPPPVIVATSGCTGAHINTGAAAPVPIPWRQIP